VKRRRNRGPFGLEHRDEPLATPAQFRKHLYRSATFAFVIIAVSLAIGVVGYRVFGGLTSWVDCLYNASMILGGMGPVDELHGDAGKIFASLYAIYSGVVLLASVGILLAPLFHRILHRFHIEADGNARE
jgi:hypothetical protein